MAALMYDGGQGPRETQHNTASEPSFTQGMANGVAIHRLIDARMVHHQVYKGCMYQLGGRQASR